MAKAKSNPDPQFSRKIEDAVLARLESEGPPPGAAAGLFGKGGGGKLKKIVQAVAPGILKGALLAGMDGVFAPDEIIGIVTDAVRRVIALRNDNADDTSPSPNAA